MGHLDKFRYPCAPSTGAAARRGRDDNNNNTRGGYGLATMAARQRLQASDFRPQAKKKKKKKKEKKKKKKKKKNL
jgi:hypothetical protein